MIKPKFGWREFTNIVSQRIGPGEPDVRDEFAGWETNLHARLEIGASEYGDSSYQRDFSALVGEILQENLDRAGWSYIMWVKANAMLQTEGLDAATIISLNRIVEVSLSTAHRAFGAYLQDFNDYVVPADIADSPTP